VCVADARSVCDCYKFLLFVGLMIMVDDTTDLTSWFLSTDDDSRSFTGVELSKRNESLIVSFRTGTGIIYRCCCLLLLLLRKIVVVVLWLFVHYIVGYIFTSLVT